MWLVIGNDSLTLIVIENIKHRFRAVVGAAVAGGGAVIQWSEGWWFDPQPLQSVCQSVLRQDTEPLISPDAASWVCECSVHGYRSRWAVCCRALFMQAVCPRPNTCPRLTLSRESQFYHSVITSTNSLSYSEEFDVSKPEWNVQNPVQSNMMSLVLRWRMKIHVWSGKLLCSNCCTSKEKIVLGQT